MSNITSLILITAIDDTLDKTPSIDILNAWIKQNYGDICCFIKIDEKFGGNKYMGSDVYGTAINFLDVEKFMEAFNWIEWEVPVRVQLLLQKENDLVFAVHQPIVKDGGNHENAR